MEKPAFSLIHAETGRAGDALILFGGGGERQCMPPCSGSAGNELREILNDDQKKKRDQLEHAPHPELHGNLNATTPPSKRHHRFEEIAVVWRSRRRVGTLTLPVWVGHSCPTPLTCVARTCTERSRMGPAPAKACIRARLQPCRHSHTTTLSFRAKQNDSQSESFCEVRNLLFRLRGTTTFAQRSN